MRTTELVEELANLMACNDATYWIDKNKNRNPSWLWNNCPKSEWLLWLIDELNLPRIKGLKKPLVEVACDCARMVAHLIPEEDNQVIKALEAAETWCKGKARPSKVAKLLPQTPLFDMSNATQAAYFAARSVAAVHWAGDAVCSTCDEASEHGGVVFEKLDRKCAIIIAKHIPWSVVCKELEQIGGPF